MTISEKKMQIVIDNYFKSECDVNTSIRQAFEKGFSLGVKKVASEPKTKTGKWVMPNKELTDRPMAECSICGWYVNPKWADDYNFCPNCGIDMRGNNND